MRNYKKTPGDGLLLFNIFDISELRSVIVSGISFLSTYRAEKIPWSIFHILCRNSIFSLVLSPDSANAKVWISFRIFYSGRHTIN